MPRRAHKKLNARHGWHFFEKMLSAEAQLLTRCEVQRAILLLTCWASSYADPTDSIK
jgi:hypothetical protein